MLNPRNASVAFTPMDLRNKLRTTVGRLIVLPTSEVANALDPATVPFTHEVYARPPQANTYTETVPVVPEGEADAIRGAMLTAIRLIVLDGLDATMVLGAFATHLDGWSDALPDRRLRGRQRLALR